MVPETTVVLQRYAATDSSSKNTLDQDEFLVGRIVKLKTQALPLTDFLPTVGSNPLGPQPPSGELRHPPRVTQYMSGIVPLVGGAPSRTCYARFSQKDLVARAAAVQCGPAN